MNVKMRLMGAAALGLMVAGCSSDGSMSGNMPMASARPMTDPAMPGAGGTPMAAAPMTSRTMMPVTNTRQAQAALTARGYNAGPADGVWGRRSMSAAMGFQRANGMRPTGRLDRPLMAALGTSSAPMPAASMSPSSSMMDRSGTMMSQAPSNNRSGVATDADPGTGGTGGSGGSAQRPTSPNLGGTIAPNDRLERSGTATGADPGSGGTGGSGGSSATESMGRGAPSAQSPAGGTMERSGTATGADPGSGGTGGSGGGSTGAPR